MPTFLPLRDHLLLLLFLGVALLLSIAIGFAVRVFLLRMKNERVADHWHQIERTWEPVVLDVIAGDRDLTAFWSIVEPRDARFAVNYLQRFCRQLVGVERERLRDMAHPYLRDFANLARHRDPHRRAWAVQTLGDLGLADHLDTIKAALDDPSPLVAMVAARALARPAHPEHLPLVLDRLQRFTSWSPNFLASMLAMVGTDAAPTLRAVLEDARRTSEVRVVATTALMYLRDLPSADAAARQLEESSDRELRAAALRLLGRVGGAGQRAAVRPLLTASDPVLRATAAAALGNMGDAEDLERLQSVCEDDSRWVALHAARALRDAGQTETLQRLASSGRARATLAMQVLSEVDR
jgi:HEAT repeat protein